MFGVGLVTVLTVVGLGGVGWSRNVSSLSSQNFRPILPGKRSSSIFHRFEVDFDQILGLVRSWVVWGPLGRVIRWIRVHHALGLGLFVVPSFGARPLFTKEVARVLKLQSMSCQIKQGGRNKVKISIWLQNLMTTKDEILLMSYLTQIKLETYNFKVHAVRKQDTYPH